jgi:hypothetical protein
MQGQLIAIPCVGFNSPPNPIILRKVIMKKCLTLLFLGCILALLSTGCSSRKSRITMMALYNDCEVVETHKYNYVVRTSSNEIFKVYYNGMNGILKDETDPAFYIRKIFNSKFERGFKVK